MYSIEFDFGTGWEDYSAKLAGRQPVTRSRSIHNGFKPVIGTVRFALTNDATIVNRFMTTSGTVKARVKRDGAPYFLGTVRATHKAKVGRNRLEYFQIEVVDALYRLDKKCRASAFYSNIQLSKPSAKASSLLHQIFYLAGFTDAELDFPEILEIIEAATLDADKDKSYREIVESILRDTAYSAYADESGVVRLYDLAPTSIPTTATLTLGPSGNVAESIDIERAEARSEAVDVTYYPRVLLGESTIFEDTTGGGNGLACNIQLAAGQYYPEGANAGASVRADYKLSDYDILSVLSPSLVIASSGVQVLDQSAHASGRGMMLRLFSPSGGTITKLQIKGTPLVKGDKCKVVKENVANSEKREALELEWTSNKPAAERVAIARARWHDKGAYRYAMQTTATALKPGDYVAFSDSVITGITQALRVVTVEDGPNEQAIKIVCEGVSAYVYESLPQSVTSGAPAPSAGLVELQRDQLAAMASDGIVTPQEKAHYAQRWAEINGDGVTTGSFWATRGAAVASSVPTDEIDLARERLNAQLFASPGVLLPETMGLNTIVEAATFYGCFAEYFRAESATLATIARYAGDAIGKIDCGDYNFDAPENASELDGGDYQPITADMTEIDLGDFASDEPTEVIDPGDYAAEAPQETEYDCGEYTPPSDELVLPALVIDGGIYD